MIWMEEEEEEEEEAVGMRGVDGFGWVEEEKAFGMVAWMSWSVAWSTLWVGGWCVV